MSKEIEKLSHELGLLLSQKGLLIAIAESCTGGGLCQAITATSESSTWFDRGFITYSNQSKIDLLNVNPKTLEKYGAVSAETAAEMAEGALKNSKADITASITGIAGPSGGSPEKPVGTVWFGLAQKNKKTNVMLQHFAGDRHQIQTSAIHFALQSLLTQI